MAPKKGKKSKKKDRERKKKSMLTKILHIFLLQVCLMLWDTDNNDECECHHLEISNFWWQ